MSGAKRRLLELYAHGGKAPGPSAGKISRRPAGAPAPLSLAQEQTLLEESLAGDALPYNESVTIQTNSHVNATALKSALDEVIRRHEIWRTTYDNINGETEQLIHSAPLEFPWQVIDLRNLPESARQQELARITRKAARVPFDLRNGPLLRALLVRLTETDQRLFLLAHFSILDGVSVYQILPMELATLYNAFSTGQSASLPDLPIQYGDYAYWQRHWMKTEECARELRYWEEKLGKDMAYAYSSDASDRLPIKNHLGAIQTFSVGHDLTEMLDQLARSYGVTLFTVLVASFGVLLHCYTGRVEICIGTPSCGERKRTELQGLLGNFLSAVALRIDLSGNPSFAAVLTRVHHEIAEALTNDHVPLEYLSKVLTGPAKASAAAVSTAISLQPQTKAAIPGWQVTSMDVESGGAAWDKYVAFLSTPEGLAGRIQYKSTLFDPQTILQITCDLRRLMKCATDNPEGRLSELRRFLRAQSASAAAS